MANGRVEKVQTGVSFEVAVLNKADLLALVHRCDRSAVVNSAIDDMWSREFPQQTVEQVRARLIDPRRRSA